MLLGLCSSLRAESWAEAVAVPALLEAAVVVVVAVVVAALVVAVALSLCEGEVGSRAGEASAMGEALVWVVLSMDEYVSLTDIIYNLDV